jgi:hypothetical protein
MLVELSHGGMFAPGMVYYRIVNEREHRKAMKHVAEMGGHEPQDEWDRDDNVLISYDSAHAIIESNRPRRMSEFDEGWDIRIQIDPWEAFSHYGYDAGDTLGR